MKKNNKMIRNKQLNIKCTKLYIIRKKYYVKESMRLEDISYRKEHCLINLIPLKKFV